MNSRPRPTYERGYAARPLTDQQIFRASTLWDEDGKSLGEIAQEVGCSVYQLGFLYRELLPYLRRGDIQKKNLKPIVLPRGNGLYAVGFRDLTGLLPGYEAGPASLRDMKSYTPEQTPPDATPVIVHLTHPVEVIAVWDSKHLCWVVTRTKTKRA